MFSKQTEDLSHETEDIQEGDAHDPHSLPEG